jgi:phosphonate transport system ATP-binding protein
MEEVRLSTTTATKIEVLHLAKVFPNGYQALHDVSFTLHGGEFVCVIGRSGAGKSTLLRCLNGLIPITSGSVRIDGVDLATLSDNARLKMRRRIGFIFQEFNLVGRLTAMQNVLTGRLGYLNEMQALLGYYGRSHRTIAVACLKRVNMLHRANNRADALSGGEKQRVAIARALAQQPVLLLADEPVASLDPELTWGVMGDLKRVSKEADVPTVVNIHDLETAKHFADRIIGIAGGRILYDGSPALLTNDTLREIYRSDDPSASSRYEVTIEDTTNEQVGMLND